MQNFQNPQMPMQNNANTPMPAVDPVEHIQGVLRMLGVSTAQFAQEAERIGIGQAVYIHQALEFGDARPLEEYARKVAMNNPQLMNPYNSYMGRMYGGSPMPTGR